ncbi:MAG: SprT-like domain-containing protein [Thermoplasmata archaeon]
MTKDLRFNREAWLRAAYALLRKKLLPKAPERVAISWSFPSKGGTKASRRTIGECHYKEGSTGGRVEGNRVVLISPTLRKPYELLECLVHEMVHTVTGPKAGHRAAFSQLAASIGLVKPWTATTAGPELRKKLVGYLKVLPKWPGGFLTIQTRQKNRQLKATCSCDEPRILRASRAMFEQGSILCGVCESEFELDV